MLLTMSQNRPKRRVFLSSQVGLSRTWTPNSQKPKLNSINSRLSLPTLRSVSNGLRLARRSLTLRGLPALPQKHSAIRRGQPASRKGSDGSKNGHSIKPNIHRHHSRQATNSNTLPRRRRRMGMPNYSINPCVLCHTAALRINIRLIRHRKPLLSSFIRQHHMVCHKGSDAGAPYADLFRNAST